MESGVVVDGHFVADVVAALVGVARIRSARRTAHQSAVEDLCVVSGRVVKVPVASCRPIGTGAGTMSWIDGWIHAESRHEATAGVSQGVMDLALGELAISQRIDSQIGSLLEVMDFYWYKIELEKKKTLISNLQTNVGDVDCITKSSPLALEEQSAGRFSSGNGIVAKGLNVGRARRRRIQFGHQNLDTGRFVVPRELSGSDGGQTVARVEAVGVAQIRCGTGGAVKPKSGPGQFVSISTGSERGGQKSCAVKSFKKDTANNHCYG